MKLKDLFASDVTRDIPPVVYFHEQTPAKLEEEVKEYIVTGGWPEGHPNHRRVPNFRRRRTRPSSVSIPCARKTRRPWS